MRASDGPDRPEAPDELSQLDRTLRRVRFSPRSSLGAELAGRVRRGEQPAATNGGRSRWWRAPLLAGLTGLAAVVLLLPEGRVTVDHCCYDLDGGGIADDGAVIVGERDGRVFRLQLYEDRDGSESFTPGDIMRYDRRGTVPEQPLTATGTRIQHCCHDLDGGGPPDDGIFVVATPPDRVHAAAIYQLR